MPIDSTDEAAVTQPAVPYDAILLVSFGGPEGPNDVLPFMENVTRGRGIPKERLVEVSAHYDLFGGVSPINGQNRALLDALRPALTKAGINLPVFWGNRNWNPLLTDTLRDMNDGGISKALAFVTSAYSSASGCRQYRENISSACSAIDEASGSAPIVDKIRVFYNHPGFIEPMVDAACVAISSLRSELGTELEVGLGEGSDIRLACTAHSIPMTMADTSDYAKQLNEASRLVCEGVSERFGSDFSYSLVYQSRSGAPGQPWLEPDICDLLSTMAGDGADGVVMIPLGFISDHMEVVYDLDTQARDHAVALGLPIRRAATVGTDPRFIDMIVELIQERIDLANGVEPIRRAIGNFGPNHDVCPLNCCPNPQRPPR